MYFEAGRGGGGGSSLPNLKNCQHFLGERFLLYLRLSGEGRDSERLGTTD